MARRKKTIQAEEDSLQDDRLEICLFCHKKSEDCRCEMETGEDVQEDSEEEDEEELCPYCEAPIEECYCDEMRDPDDEN